MKARWHNVIILITVIFLAGNVVAGEQKPFNRKEALVFAEQTPEAAALYALEGGKYVNCIGKSVMRPCETDWVTCIDDAWVVKFQIGEECGVSHDGRVDLVLLIDAVERKVISRYPEKEYYFDPGYCQLHDDCLMLADKRCYNFVYGQILSRERIKGHCECRKGACRESND